LCARRKEGGGVYGVRANLRAEAALHPLAGTADGGLLTRLVEEAPAAHGGVLPAPVRTALGEDPAKGRNLLAGGIAAPCAIVPELATIVRRAVADTCASSRALSSVRAGAHTEKGHARCRRCAEGTNRRV
jgi:hypothetical protein